MITKYTLYKFGDFYHMLLGYWIDANKLGFLQLKHGVLSSNERDEITRKKQAVFDWNERYKIYEYHINDKKKAGVRETIDQLYLYPSETNRMLYTGRFRKGKSTAEIARLRLEMEIENAKPCTYEEGSNNQ